MRFLPLASKFEGYGGELLRSRAHDDPSNLTRASVEDMIELVLEQQGRLGGSAVDDPVGALVEVGG